MSVPPTDCHESPLVVSSPTHKAAISPPPEGVIDGAVTVVEFAVCDEPTVVDVAPDMLVKPRNIRFDEFEKLYEVAPVTTPSHWNRYQFSDPVVPDATDVNADGGVTVPFDRAWMYAFSPDANEPDAPPVVSTAIVFAPVAVTNTAF